MSTFQQFLDGCGFVTMGIVQIKIVHRPLTFISVTKVIKNNSVIYLSIYFKVGIKKSPIRTSGYYFIFMYFYNVQKKSPPNFFFFCIYLLTRPNLIKAKIYLTNDSTVRVYIGHVYCIWFYGNYIIR